MAFMVYRVQSHFLANCSTCIHDLPGSLATSHLLHGRRHICPFPRCIRFRRLPRLLLLLLQVLWKRRQPSSGQRLIFHIALCTESRCRSDAGVGASASTCGYSMPLDSGKGTLVAVCTGDRSLIDVTHNDQPRIHQLPKRILADFTVETS